jgi:Ca2+-transporting ATPase
MVDVQRTSPIAAAWQFSPEAVARQLGTDLQKGLSPSLARQRLQQYGPNELNLYRPTPLFVVFLRQFTSPLVWVLAVAGGLAYGFGEWLEGTAILAVILINAAIGFFMERQAIRSMEALRQLALMGAKVYRGGQLQRINATELVPGDLVFLEAGDVIPADARILEPQQLEVKEAALTGESTPIAKQPDPQPMETVLADRRNMLFKGTIVVRGNTRAIVTATGQQTELGRISHLAHTAEKASTPLEKKLQRLGQRLLWLMGVLILPVLLIGLLQGRDLYLMVKTAVALGIAAMPEGLPIVATIALARGMLRLARHQVVVKNLNAVETLGETQVIFTDKTGTLTENQLTVDQLVYAQDMGDTAPAAQQLVKVAVLCNNAALNHQSGAVQQVGDPLEVALLAFARDQGEDPEALRQQFPRLREIPFDSDTKMMGTLHENATAGNYLVCLKGAVEVVLPESDHFLTAGGKQKLVNHSYWTQLADELSANGLRTLALAYSEIEEPEDAFLHNLILIGLIGFLDPPREEVKAAIATCQSAGIKVIMVTGDHPETARHIAYRTGLTDEAQSPTLHGRALNALDSSDPAARQQVLATRVFARVTPAQKLDLVRTYQEEGAIVGMLGDGINDAPALKKADIGIAMGQRGTEAAKEVADLVLKNDAFTSVVLAIKQGRGIFQNIRYFAVYLLSCNLGEILVVATASLANLVMPLLPLQILFLNMVTDVFPALALGVNKEGADVMQHPPRDSREPIINPAMWRAIVVYALGLTLPVMGMLVFAVFYLEASAGVANNLTFYTLILAQLWHVFNLPSYRQSFFRNEITQNRFIWLAILLCILLVGLAYAIPILREVLQLEPIPWNWLILVVPFSLLPIFFVQLFKRLRLII